MRCAFLLVVVLGACQCPPLPRAERIVGENLATPENSIEYFRAAFRLSDEQGATHQQYLCFSETLKAQQREKGTDLTVFNYAQVRDDIRTVIETRVGRLDDVEIEDVEFVKDSPHLARVTLASKGGRGVVQLIQETSYTVFWKNPDIGETTGLLPFGTNPVSLDKSQLVLELALGSRPEATADDVYEIHLERGWKFLGFEGSDFASDLEDLLKKNQAKKPVRT